MAARFVALASLVVVGVIIADIVTHGSSFAQAAGGVQYIENPALDALLGKAP
jgi:hypothetical protein